MIRNFIGILFFILSGTFLTTLNFLAFFDFSHSDVPASAIFGVIGGFFLVLHLIGLLFYRKTNWKLATGITILTSCSISLMSLLTFVCMQYSTTMNHLLTSDGDHLKLVMFNQYISGAICSLLLIIIGLILYRKGQRQTSYRRIFS